MATYQLSEPLSDIDLLENAFRQKVGEKYKYTITRNNAQSNKVTRLFGLNYDKILIKKNAYHGVELVYQNKDGKHYLTSGTVTPNAFLSSVLGRVGILDILIARAIFGTKKELVEDVNDVVTSSFQVTVLDTSISATIKNMFGKNG